MPYVNLQITKGATRDQKKKVVEEFTASLVRHLAKKPEHIHIVIEEVDDENWGYAGMLTDDFKKTQRQEVKRINQSPEPMPLKRQGSSQAPKVRKG